MANDMECRLRTVEKQFRGVIAGVISLILVCIFGFYMLHWQLKSKVDDEFKKQIGVEHLDLLARARESATNIDNFWTSISTNKLIKDASGKPLHIVVGETRLTEAEIHAPESKSSTNTIWVDIPIPPNFSGQPRIFTSLGGQNHSDIIGTSSIYYSIKDKFRIYLHKPPQREVLSKEFALESGLTIKWMAVGSPKTGPQ